MALEFYNITDRQLKQLLFKLDDADLNIIEPILSKYRALTGLDIDRYGTTHISQGHIELMMTLLDDFADKNGAVDKQLLKIGGDFRRILDGCIAVGD